MKAFLLLCSLAICTINCLAQTDEPPAPPLTGQEVAENSAPAPRYEDNVRPLSGVQNYDVGTRTEYMNMIVPAFTFSGSYGTNPGYSYGPSGETVWGSTTNLGGSLRLMRGSTNKLFSMSYLGSGELNSYDSNRNTQVHSLEITQSITTGRWTYLVGDTLSYSPNAYGGYTPLLFPGIGTSTPGGGFQPGVTPNDSVLTSQNTQLNNTALGQVTYGLSRVSSLTGSVSYGILRYLDGDFLDNHQLNLTGGFDHRFGRNTMGVSYTYSKFMYDQFEEDFGTHTIHLTYARRIIGRVSLALRGGPSIRSTNAGVFSDTNTDFTGSASLQYAGTKTNYALSYSRAVTGGSGVVIGALTDTVSVSGSAQMTRSLTANASGGYTRNSAIYETYSQIVGAGMNYNTFFIGAGISRQVGRYMSLAMGYRGQRQTSDVRTANFTSHAAVVSLQWRLRPIRLQ